MCYYTPPLPDAGPVSAVLADENNYCYDEAELEAVLKASEEEAFQQVPSKVTPRCDGVNRHLIILGIVKPYPQRTLKSLH